jgi:COP9 signalosome complex subunit 1
MSEDHRQRDFIESINSRYKGIARVKRLCFLVDRVNAGSVAQKRAQELVLDAIAQPESLNCDLFRQKVIAYGSTISPHHTAWLEKAEKDFSIRKLMIEQEMAQCQASQIREQLRRCHVDAAAISIAHGDIVLGKQHLQHAKDYCTNSKQMIDVSLASIELALLSSDWVIASSLLTRNELLAVSKDDNQNIEEVSKVRVAQGILALVQSLNLSVAARHFLSVSASLGDSLNTVVHIDDISTYAIVCALGSFSRDELKQHVLGNARAKALLELQPGLCEAVKNTVNGRYSEARDALEAIHGDLLLDEFIAPFVDTIYRGMQMRSMVSYITPYTVVDLRIMATTFKRSHQEIVKDAAELIKANFVSGRIDAQELTLTRHTADPREIALNRILDDGRIFLAEAMGLVLRGSMTKEQLLLR